MIKEIDIKPNSNNNRNKNRNQKSTTVIKFKQKVKQQNKGVAKRRKIRNGILNKRNVKTSGSNYLRSLFYPELMANTENFIPRFFLGSTIPFNLHLTISITTNALGNFMGMIDPFNLLDNSLSSTNTTLFINKSAGYAGADPGNFTNLLGVALGSFQTPINTVASFRLVSSCLYIVSGAALLNRSGKIGGAIVPMLETSNVINGNPYANTNVPTAIQAFTAIESFPNYAESNVSSDKPTLRLCWYPANLHDYDFYALDSPDDPSGSFNDQSNSFVFYGSSLGASVAVNLELYLNYEILPQINSTAFRFAKNFISLEDPIIAKAALLSDLKNVARPVIGQYCVDDMESHSHPFTNSSVQQQSKQNSRMPTQVREAMLQEMGIM